MKNITEKTKYIQSHIVDWVFIKGPELFVTIYGK
jgi:hypothetical protein